MSIDKSAWGDGPWQHEPDQRMWVDEASGLRCVVRRHPRLGSLNGYVIVPLGHVLHGCDIALDVDLDGGLSFADRLDDDSWWLGFDCAHFCDLAPGTVAAIRAAGVDDPIAGCGVYRTFEWVCAETTRLAAQCAEIEALDRMVREP